MMNSLQQNHQIMAGLIQQKAVAQLYQQPSSPNGPHGSVDSGNLSDDHQDIQKIENQSDEAYKVAPRAGSKRTPEEIEEAVMRKKLRNRESAQRARDRQKARMRWLEEEVTRITTKNDQMLKENLLLRQVLNEQGNKINELLRRDEERQDSKSRINDVKSEIKVEKIESSEAPKSKGLWRPGIDSACDKKIENCQERSQITLPATEDHLARMRLNMLQNAENAAQAVAAAQNSTNNPYSSLIEQSRMGLNLPYFPLSTLNTTPSLSTYPSTLSHV